MGLGLILLAVAILLVFLGIRRRKRAYAEYQTDNRVYTAETPMTIIGLDKRNTELWEDTSEGNREIRYYTEDVPTYEYTVNGTTYHYTGNKVSQTDTGVGSTVTGYYEPANPENITEFKPGKPALGGIAYFLGAAFLLFLAAVTILGEM